MAIDFACACGRQFRVKDEMAGRRAKCPRCSRDLLVPAATSLRAAPPAYSAPRPTPAYQAPPAYQQPSPYQAPSPQAAYQQYPPPGASLPQGDMQPPAAAYMATGYPPGTYGNAPRIAAPLGSFHRKGLFITLGIILVLGFILPVVEAHRDYSSSPYSRYPSARSSNPEMKWETEFVNITGLTEKGVPFVARVLCIAPLLAGIAVLIVAFTSRGVVRGAVTGGSALLPLFIVFMAALSDDDAGRVSRRMFSQLGAGMGIVVVLAALGTTAFLAGLLASRHRPDYRAIAIVTLVGAGLYVLCHFIPTGKDIKSMPIVAAFASSELDGFEVKGRGFMRMCDILSLLGGLTAAGLTLAFMGNKMTRERARIFFWILVGSVGLGFLGKMSMVIGSADSERLVPALLTTIKIIAWLLGLLVLIPVGLSEFLLGMAARSSPATAGHGFPVHMGYSAGGPSAYQQGGYPQESSFR